MLRNAGFQVEEAGDGAHAVAMAMAMAMRLQPRLMILDVKLPDISGFDVCRQIKATAATAHILVIQTSAALISPTDRSRGLDSSADHYLASPFEPGDLVRQVRALLGQHSLLSRLLPACIIKLKHRLASCYHRIVPSCPAHAALWHCQAAPGWPARDHS